MAFGKVRKAFLYAGAAVFLAGSGFGLYTDKRMDDITRQNSGLQEIFQNESLISSLESELSEPAITGNDLVESEQADSLIRKYTSKRNRLLEAEESNRTLMTVPSIRAASDLYRFWETRDRYIGAVAAVGLTLGLGAGIGPAILLGRRES